MTRKPTVSTDQLAREVADFALRERGAIDFLDYRQRSIVLTDKAAA